MGFKLLGIRFGKPNKFWSKVWTVTGSIAVGAITGGVGGAAFGAMVTGATAAGGVAIGASTLALGSGIAAAKAPNDGKVHIVIGGAVTDKRGHNPVPKPMSTPVIDAPISINNYKITKTLAAVPVVNDSSATKEAESQAGATKKIHVDTKPISKTISINDGKITHSVAVSSEGNNVCISVTKKTGSAHHPVICTPKLIRKQANPIAGLEISQQECSDKRKNLQTKTTKKICVNSAAVIAVATTAAVVAVAPVSAPAVISTAGAAMIEASSST
jgi:hypothetical protein